MKLASLKGGRDGRLAVVSRDLSRALPAEGVAATLQDALDDWARSKPALEALARELESGRAKGAPFDPSEAHSPQKPRGGQAVCPQAVQRVVLSRPAASRA